MPEDSVAVTVDCHNDTLHTFSVPTLWTQCYAISCALTHTTQHWTPCISCDTGWPVGHLQIAQVCVCVGIGPTKGYVSGRVVGAGVSRWV